MSSVFRFIVVILILFSVSVCAAPHLLLHFDINKTLIATDKAAHQSKEEVVNQLLAEKYLAFWEESPEEPISFAEYAYKLFPEDRQQRKEFVGRFLDYLRDREHPLYDEAVSEYKEVFNALGASRGEIFASFYHLIDTLNEEGASYSILLRSFGEDIDDVKNEINIAYPDMIARTGEFRQGILYLDDDSVAAAPNEIYLTLKNLGHAAIHDDWSDWFVHGFKGRYGKAFYVDQEDEETISLFFDDNIRLDGAERNIAAPLDAKSGEEISIQNLIRVDTLRAIMDSGYYLRFVRQAVHKNEVCLEACAH